MLPGLYESYVPRGISTLDDSSYLITMLPTGRNAGRPSIIVRMEQKKGGTVMRIFQIYQRHNATHSDPFTGTVPDVAVSSHKIDDADGTNYVWTSDDAVDEYVLEVRVGRHPCLTTLARGC